MKIKRESELMLEIKEEYDKDPYNWRILRGRDSKQHINTFIAHDDKNLWQLKTELKNPGRPIGLGTCVKRKLDDDIQELMGTGSDLPIHEVYPSKDNFILALGFGKYSQTSTDQLNNLLRESASYKRQLEKDINIEFDKLLKKEQLFNHYI